MNLFKTYEFKGSWAKFIQTLTYKSNQAKHFGEGLYPMNLPHNMHIKLVCRNILIRQDEASYRRQGNITK